MSNTRKSQPFLLNTLERNIVVGMGPVGLASVLELARNDSKHRKIIAFTNRSAYTRKQVLKVEDEDIEYVKSLVGREKVDKLFRHDKMMRDYDRMRKHHVVSFKTKVLEKLLDAELKPYQDQGLLEIIDVATPQNKIKKIDKHEHTVELENGRVIPMANLVEADGAGHRLADQLHDVEDLPIEYFPAQKDQLHEWHAVINFKLPVDKSADDYRDRLPNHEDVIALDRIPVKADPEMIAELELYGWKHSSLPEVRIFCNSGQLYFGGECPEQMKDTPEQWARVVLRTYLPQNYIDDMTVFVDAHGKRDANTFKVELREATQPVFKFPKSMANDKRRNSARLVLMGDALRTSHFQAGSGALTGLRETKAFGEFLKTQQTSKDWDDFIQALNKLRDINRERVDGYLAMRGKRERNDYTPTQTRKHQNTNSPVAQEIDDAYELLGIDRNPLYVCDASVAIPRFEKAYKDVMEKKGKISLLEERKLRKAARVIRDDLESRVFRSTAACLPDFTSRLHEDGADTCTLISEGKAKDLSMSYSMKYDLGAYRQSKLYHFTRFDLTGTEDECHLENQKACQVRIDSKGNILIVIPEYVGALDRQLRGRFKLNVRVPHLSDSDPYFPAEISTSLPNKSEVELRKQFAAVLKDTGKYSQDASALSSGFGYMGYQFNLQSFELDKALRIIHAQFCTNKNLTVEQFVQMMQEKVVKKSAPREPVIDIDHDTKLSNNRNSLFAEVQPEFNLGRKVMVNIPNDVVIAPEPITKKR